MRRLPKLGLGVSFLFVCIAVAPAAEKPVQMKDLPPAVQKTVEAQSQGAKVRSLSKEIENGKTFYEAELEVNGHGKDVLIDSAGTVVEVEEEVALTSLPPAAKAAIENFASKGKILKLESVTHGRTVFYEAKVEKAGKKTEFKVKPDGSLVPRPRK